MLEVGNCDRINGRSSVQTKDDFVLSYDMSEVTKHILHRYRYKQCDPDSYYRFKQWGINKLVKY